MKRFFLLRSLVRFMAVFVAVVASFYDWCHIFLFFFLTAVGILLLFFFKRLSNSWCFVSLLSQFSYLFRQLKKQCHAWVENWANCCLRNLCSRASHAQPSVSYSVEKNTPTASFFYSKHEAASTSKRWLWARQMNNSRVESSQTVNYICTDESKGVGGGWETVTPSQQLWLHHGEPVLSSLIPLVTFSPERRSHHTISW